MHREEEVVFFRDWCIMLVGGFLDFKDLCRWDVAMCSRREKWLEALSNVRIAGIDDYRHQYNESIRWLISRRIKHVAKITVIYCYKVEHMVSGKTFSGAAKRLTNLKSFVLHTCIGYHEVLISLKVNCPNLEEVKIVSDDVGDSLSFADAAGMVQKLYRLRCFSFTMDTYEFTDNSEGSEGIPIQQSSSPLLLALAQYCPLLESLNLAKYDDEGLAELVAGCPKLHTLTIAADTSGFSIAGYLALGQSRSITNLHINTFCLEGAVEVALSAMAGEGMPIKTLELYTNYRYRDTSFEHGVSSIARFARTLEHLTIKNLADITDNDLEVLDQCHNLRSIEIKNAEIEDYDDSRFGRVSGAFLIPMSVGCPLLERVVVNEIMQEFIEYRPVDAVDFRPFFERCPKLKHVELDIRTDEDIKVLAQHCPLVELIKLGSSTGIIPQHLSEISDDSLVAIAQNLHFLTHIYLNCTQCTDEGILALVQGKCSMLKELHIHKGKWTQGYPELITIEGIKKFDAVMKNVLKVTYL